MKNKEKTLTWISHDEIIERDFGPIGTPRRDRFEIRHLFWSIAKHIVEKRQVLGLSQEDLAERTGFDIKDIKRIERGGVTTPIPNIHKVWRVLGIYYVNNELCDGPIAPEEKQTHKHPITKQSPPLRTLVR